MAKAKKKTAKKSTTKKSTKKSSAKKGTKSLSQRNAEKFADAHKITTRQAAQWAAGKRKLWKEIVGS